MSQLTELLGRMRASDAGARVALFAAAYAELHRLSRAWLRQGAHDVHEALEELEQAEPRLAQVAQMRYFGGYSEQEIAETLDITERTVQRDREKARLILAETLR